MNNVNPCDAFRSQLVELALGSPNAELEAHVRQCGRCAKTLAHLQTMVAALAVSPSVPREWTEQAVRVFPKRVRARLLGSSLQLAAARSSTGEPFLMRFEVPGGELSVMYRPIASGWEALGELSTSSAKVSWTRGALSLSPEGRFRATSAHLSGFEFEVEVEGETVAIPTPEEADASSE